MNTFFLNTNDHKWPVNFREYFLTECFWSHAESAEDAENALTLAPSGVDLKVASLAWPPGRGEF